FSALSRGVAPGCMDGAPLGLVWATWFDERHLPCRRHVSTAVAARNAPRSVGAGETLGSAAGLLKSGPDAEMPLPGLCAGARKARGNAWNLRGSSPNGAKSI